MSANVILINIVLIIIAVAIFTILYKCEKVSRKKLEEKLVEKYKWLDSINVGRKKRYKKD